MTTLTDPMNRVTSWTFDGFGRPDRKVYPDASYEQVSWLNMAQPQKLKNRRGQETSFSYDYNGNLKTLVGPGVNVTRNYDGWDRL